ncbi:MAG TPA: tRNA threonylcarbamoyladenosine biosynthesis protein TsaB [Aquifex aeolicus]|nr:tRNA threonylcarbamoyladenosine biosynthesis protein TsaB [Aquifex aeolicus]
MKLFSLDTSFFPFNFSVVEDGKLRELYYLSSEKKTLENLPEILSKHGVELSCFDAFAVSVGVGYLTSLRIGVTFMKTVAYILRKPIVPYENLYLLGRFTPVESPKIPFLRVSTNLFYRVFEESVSEVRLYGGESLKGIGVGVSDLSGNWPGEGAFYHPFFPFSAYGGLYAWEFLQENPAGKSVFEIEPLYLKPPL